MSDIFLSYSREDAKMMDRLRTDLHGVGFSVWTDEGLAPGTPHWQRAIEEAITNARCVVVILSPSAKESEWVEREISYAQRLDLLIFPILARGDEGDAIPFSLTNAQFVDIRGQYGQVEAQLVPALREHLGGFTPSAEPPKSAKWLWIILAVCVVLIGLYAAMHYFFPVGIPSSSPSSEAATTSPSASSSTRPPTSVAAESDGDPARSGLITYISENEDKKSLNVLNPDGTTTTLVQAVADVLVLDVSPDSRYLAVATSSEGTLSSGNERYPLFTVGPALNLLVVSADGEQENAVYNDISGVSATYNRSGRLIVAALDKEEKLLTISETAADGSTLPHELYSTKNDPPSPSGAAPAAVPVEAGAPASKAEASETVLYRHDFSDDDGNWPVSSDSGDWGTAKASLTNGKYRFTLTVNQSSPYQYRYCLENHAFDNFSLSVEARRIEPPVSEPVAYGVVFRREGREEYYELRLNDRGEYKVNLRDEDYVALVDWTESALINNNDMNQIEIKAIDSTLSFSANGQRLTEITDDTWNRGRICFFLWNSGNQSATIDFDNLVVREAP